MEITLYTLAAFAKNDAAKRYGNYHSERHDYQVVYSSINMNNHTITVAIKDMKFPTIGNFDLYVYDEIMDTLTHEQYCPGKRQYVEQLSEQLTEKDLVQPKMIPI